VPRLNMRASSERVWIIVLGVVAAILLLVLVVVVLTGGDDDSASAQPSVSIQDLRSIGYDAVIDFTVSNGGSPAAVSVDWGDASSPLSLRGEGELSASHSYPPEAVNPVVTVTITTSDGSTLSATRTLALAAGGPADTSTTTEDPDGTTTTTGAPATTTTTPERQTITIELVPSDAVFRGTGTGEGTAQLNGRTVLLYAQTSGLNEESVRTAKLTWRFPASAIEGLEGLYQVRVRVEPSWEVQLQASVNSGRAAAFFVDLLAHVGGPPEFSSASDTRSVGNNSNETFAGAEVLGFGTTMENPSGAIEVVLTLTCQAVPGSTVFQINETSTCDARDGGRGFSINYARIQFVPFD
jgi:hypothetical protein